MKQKDLTHGPVMKTMLLFALPMILGNLLQQTYNLVDTWIVGHYIGADALAAVGSSFTLMTFLTSILLGLCMGSGVVFSLNFGRQDSQTLRQSVRASFFLNLMVTILLTVLSLVLMNQIIAWLNIPLEIITYTKDYLFVIFLGIPAVFLYNFFAAYLKAVGNAKIPVFFLAVSTIINIVLDLWFIIYFSLETMGAALATIVAQYISGIGIVLYVLKTNPELQKELVQGKMAWWLLPKIANYSFMTCLQQSVMNLGILLVQGLVNSFGTEIMAAFAAGVKIDAFAYCIVQEYANAFSTFIAQNKGANQNKRISQALKYASASSFAYCMLITLVIWGFAKSLITIFIDPSQVNIIQAGITYLHIEGSFYYGIGFLFLFYGLYRAVGKPSLSLLLTIISLGTRVLLSYSLAPIIGVTAIWWSIPIGWILADGVGLIYYLKHKNGLLGSA